MWSDYSWVAEYRQILAGFCMGSVYPPSLLISYVVLHNLNECIKLSTKIGVGPYHIHLLTATNNLNRFKQSL
jgi:hypothetical protein